MNYQKYSNRGTVPNITGLFINSWKAAGRKALSIVLAIFVVVPCLLTGTVPVYAEESKVCDSSLIAGFGNALSFDGSDDVTLNKGVVLDSAYTEEAWIYPKDSENDGFHGIIMSSNEAADFRAPAVYVLDNTEIHAGFGDGTYWNSVVTDPCLTSDAWNHVAVVFDGNTIKVYVNGNPVKLTMAKSGAAVTSFNSTPYTGSSVKYLGKSFNGKMDEVRIWDTALSEEQIRDGMNRAVNEEDIQSGHLAGSWDFNESDGNTAKGLSNGIQNDNLTGTLSSGVSRCVSDVPLKYSVQKGSGATVTLTGISGNKDSSRLSYEIVSQPAHGTLTEKDSGVYEYKNDGASLEDDSFTYRVSDGESVSANTAAVELSMSGIEAQQDENSGNYVSLNWEGQPFDRYMVRQKSPDHDEFQSIPLKKSIKVLNVYPDISGSDDLQTWMETDAFGTVNGYSMTVDKVGLENDSLYGQDKPFNTYYNDWLKDENGNYKYDVIYFGGWDSNNGEDISADAEAAVKEFIDYGGGCLLGHDTVDGSTDRNFIPLAKEYLNMILDDKNLEFYGDNTGSSTLSIVKKGMLTDYPSNLGGVGTKLTVPASHTTYQFATSDIWMKYLTDSFHNAPEITALNDNGTEYSGTNNFYLTTKNNVAMIQTGHSDGAASDDEKRVLANTLYYLAQVSTDTSFDDHTAQDVAAPEKITSVSASTDKDSKDTTIRFDAPKDSGSTYEYQLDTFDCLGNKTESDPVQATVTTGVAGYKVIVSQNETAPADSDFANVTEQTDTSYTASNLPEGRNYVHIRTYDKAENYSDSTIDFWLGNHAPQIESSTKYISLQENSETVTGTPVNDLLASASASDQDGDSLGVAVTAADSSEGEWQYQAASDGQWQTMGNVKDSGARLLPAGASIRFVPVMNFSGNASLTYRAWDGTKDSAYSVADASVYNDTGAYSAETATAIATVRPGIAVAGSGQALQFDGVDDYADIASNPAFATSNFTVEGWMKYTEKQGWSGVIDKGRNNGTDWYILTASDSNIGIVAGMPGTELGYNWDDTNWHYVSITYDGTYFTLYVDGQIVKNAKVSNYTPANNNISFGRRQTEFDGGSSNWKYYNGQLDDVRIWSTARTSEEINRDMYTYSTGDEQGLLGYWKMDVNMGGLLKNYASANSADGTISGASYIMSDAWQNRSTDKNTELTIDAGYVTDSGTPAIAVQSRPQHGSLQINVGKLIYTPVKDYFGSDSFTYTVTNQTNNNVATYSVSVTVNPTADTPVISNLPASQTIAVGGTATFDAAATVTDGGTVTYQWEKSSDGGNTWQVIGGATNGTYTTPTFSASDNGSEYRCEVTNTKDGMEKTATSTPTALTVTAAPQEPVIPAQPAPNPVAVGGTATFDAAATVTDGGAVTYQWEKSSDGGNTWQVIGGATNGTYTTPTLSTSDNGSEYRCEVTNTKDGVPISVVTEPETVIIQNAGGSDNSEHSSSSKNSDNSANDGRQNTNTGETSNSGKTETVTAKTDGVVLNGNTAEISTSVQISNDGINGSQVDPTAKTTVVVNFPTDVVKQELEAKKNVSLNVSVPHSAVSGQNNNSNFIINVSAEMIYAAKDNGCDITISVYDAETKKRAYQWQFKGEDLLKSSVKVKDIDITMSVHKIAEVPRVNAVSQQKNGLVLSFDYSGLLPAVAGIKISAAEKGFKPGDNLWFYYFNPTTDRLESTGNQYTVDANGYITVKISHCSDYVLIPILKSVQKSGKVLRLDTTIQYNMYIGGNYYFLAFPGKKVSVSARAADSSVLKVKLVNTKDRRGWYFEITGLKAGSTDVIVTASNGSVGSFPVTVKSGEMIIDTSSCTLPVNSLYDISAKIFGSDANQLRAVASNRKVASVFRLRNGHYQVRGLSLGTAKIIFMTIDGKGKVIASAHTVINVEKTEKRFGNSARITVFY